MIPQWKELKGIIPMNAVYRVRNEIIKLLLSYILSDHNHFSVCFFHVSTVEQVSAVANFAPIRIMLLWYIRTW